MQIPHIHNSLGSLTLIQALISLNITSLFGIYIANGTFPYIYLLSGYTFLY